MVVELEGSHSKNLNAEKGGEEAYKKKNIEKRCM